jgi:type II secretory pathway component HofQ
MKFFQKLNVLAIAVSLLIAAVHPASSQPVSATADTQKTIVAFKIRNTTPAIVVDRIESDGRMGIPMPGVESILPNKQTGEIWVKGTQADIEKVRSILPLYDQVFAMIELEPQIVEAATKFMGTFVSKSGIFQKTSWLAMQKANPGEQIRLSSSPRHMVFNGLLVKMRLNTPDGAKVVVPVMPRVDNQGTISLAVQFPPKTGYESPTIPNIVDGDTVAIHLPDTERDETKQLFVLITFRLVRHVADIVPHSVQHR